MKWITLFLIIVSFSAIAQPTGDFRIGFPSPDPLLTRDSVYIYFYVPNELDLTQSNKLIVGIHGIGDPSSSIEIRDYLRNTADTIGAIIANPDPYVNVDSFLVNQAKNNVVINLAIDSVLKWYDIDLSSMYLTGYSAGSDASSQYLLNNPKHKLKGFIWFSPGFFSRPNLSNQSIFPATCLCYGDQDPISNALGQVTSIRDSFANSIFPFFYNQIPDVEHTMNFPEITMELLECIRFIDNSDSVVSAISVINNKFSFDIFPHPATMNSKLFIEMNVRNSIQVNFYNIFGELLAQEIIEGAGIQQLALSHYLKDNPNGMYLINVFDGINTVTKKLIWQGQ